MIRTFKKEDLDGFVPNKYSTISDNLNVLENENIIKYSVIKNDKVLSILCFANYDGKKNYVCSLMMSKAASFIIAKEIKYFLHNMAKELELKRLQTDSIDCEFINKWHEFLGFKCEGIRKKLFNNIDYKMWAIVWE